MHANKQSLKKYWLTIKITWQNSFTYRANVFMWRLRNFLSSLMSLTIWTVIFSGQKMAFNYQQSEMITYIFLIAVLQSLVMSSALHGLAGTIYSGQISFSLLKPINLIAYLGSQDVAEKLKSFIFVLLESGLLYLIFKPNLSWPQFGHSLVFIIWSLLAVGLHFIITLLFGAIGFWSPDSWGPKFLFLMLVDFTAGKLFPIDILPQTLQTIVFLTPFPYLSYTQIQLFLGRFSWTQIGQHSLILLGWILVLAWLTHYLWQQGLKNYSSHGQ